MATMPKCSGWAFWTLGCSEPDGLATEVKRDDRRRLRQNVVAIRTPPGLGKETSQTSRVVRMAGREEFSSDNKTPYQGSGAKRGQNYLTPDPPLCTLESQ